MELQKSISRGKIVSSSVVGGLIVGALFTPFTANFIFTSSKFLPFNFFTTILLGGALGYLVGGFRFIRYQRNPVAAQSIQNLPRFNWPLILLTLFVAGSLTEILVLTGQAPNCAGQCFFIGFHFLVWAFLGSLGTIFLTFLLSQLSPKLKSRGFASNVVIFILTFIMIFSILSLTT